MSARDPAPSAGSRVSERLIGREEVLALARARWSEAAAGSGNVLLVAGEAGIGKSRILSEIETALDGPSTLMTRAWPRDAEAPGAVLIDLARGLRLAGEEALADALLERLLRVDDIGDTVRRHRLVVGDLADMVLTRIAERPTLLQIEDLHWADELSLEVLERVALLIKRTPSMIMCTYRTEEVVSGSALAIWRSRLLQQRAAEEVRLERLDEKGTARLADALLGTMAPRHFVAELYARSSGIPLHIEELIAAGGTHAVPETVAEAVRHRTARMDDVIQQIAGVAAVIGTSFEVDLLAEIADSEPTEVDRALRALLDEQLMVPLSQTRFDFRHALIRDVTYDDITPFRRRTLHEAVARASQRAGSRDSYLSEQYEMANLPAEAHPLAFAAALDASALSAHREAADLFERALRTVSTDATPSELANLNARFAMELAAVDRPRRAAEHFTTAIGLYREAGEPDAAAALAARLVAVRHLLGDGLEARVAIADEALGWLEDAPGHGTDRTRATVLGAVAAAYLMNDRLEDAMTTARNALTLAPDDLDVQITLGTSLVFAGAEEEGWPILEHVVQAATGVEHEAEAVRARRMLATSASELVEYGRARTWLDDGLDFTAEIERWNDHHYLRAHRAHVRWATGSPDAERDALRALADGRAITTEIQARTVLGYLRMSRGQFDAAREHLDRALELGRAMHEVQRMSPALWGLAEIAFYEGQFATAAALCEEALELSEEVSDAAGLFPFVLTGVRVQLAQRETSAAREWFERCAGPIRRRSIPGTLPMLDHAEGLIQFADGQLNAARESLERARSAWEERERLWEGTHVLLDLARCATRSRRPGEAAQLVAEAKHRAAASGWALIARLADGLGVDESAEPAGPLTERELEVARLVADGATNREIAERLVMSPKTAAAHVAHILAKLGVSRRSEIAAWVSRN